MTSDMPVAKCDEITIVNGLLKLSLREKPPFV